MPASPRTRRTFRRSVAAPARAVTRTRITSTIGWGRAAERVGVRGCGAGSGWPTSWSSRCAVAHERLGGAHGRLAGSGSGRGAQARTGPARAGDPGHAAGGPVRPRRAARPTAVRRADRWFTASSGIDLQEGSGGEVFCRATLDADDALGVPDTRVDPRFRMNPLVTAGPASASTRGSPSSARAATDSAC